MKRGGWARGGQLTTGNGNAFISMSVEFDEPTTFTLQAQTDQNEPRHPGGTAGFAAVVVEWTVNGITQVRRFDAVAGATITGVAETLRAAVRDNTQDPYPKGIKYGVTMSVAARTRPTTAVPPVLTVANGVVMAAGSSLEFNVPPGANSIAVYGQSGGLPATLQINEKAYYSPVDANIQLSTVPPLGEFTPLVAGVQTVQVFNTSLVAPATVTVVFGIDG